ncbi:MAG: M15 family metallopeptidase [Acidobacteria bacterium]|nr:M15 family metallopeptidase [Acidobacteriota bacterium]
MTLSSAQAPNETLKPAQEAPSSTIGPSDDATEPPAWLGTRELPVGPDGRITAQSTPPALIDRQFITRDVLPAALADEFVSTIQPLEGKVLEDSTWHSRCPVPPDELRVLTMSHWGFDGEVHTGQLIVHRSVANDVVNVFGSLYDSRFPIEEMRGVTNADLNAAPTGDGNNTAAFVCRTVTGGTSFSEHAYGLAIDVNPFHNPYIKGDQVLPELATSYLEREPVRPGMITEGDTVTTAFDTIGWGWGGRWQSLADYQHFALNDR